MSNEDFISFYHLLKMKKGISKIIKLSLYCLFIITLISCQSSKSQEEENDHCRNCGMPSKSYPKWNVTIKKQDKTTVYFCSPRCMFIKKLANNSFINSEDSIFVVDYYEQKNIDARKSFYVIKSDILSPMGNDFVPLKNKESANDFKNEHHGIMIFSFDEINDKIIDQAIQ
jgi:nitrous oxide reductase accessory protein NosL